MNFNTKSKVIAAKPSMQPLVTMSCGLFCRSHQFAERVRSLALLVLAPQKPRWSVLHNFRASIRCLTVSCDATYSRCKARGPHQQHPCISTIPGILLRMLVAARSGARVHQGSIGEGLERKSAKHRQRSFGASANPLAALTARAPHGRHGAP